MSPDAMTNYDVWRCHDPREDEPEPSEEQVEWMNEYIVDLQNEAVADHGWDLLDTDQLGEAVAYLKAHQGEYQERARRALREELEARRKEAGL